MDLRLQAPFTCIVAASTGSGKTVFVKRLLENATAMIHPPPTRIVFCYAQYQKLYTELSRTMPQIEFIPGLPEDLIHMFDPNLNNLVVIDDLMAEAGDDVRIANLFTKGSHHLNLSAILISQNLFHQGKQMRTISLNSHYFVLFRNPRDRSQILHLAKQMFPNNPKYLQESYVDATNEPYSYLLIDMKPQSDDNYRLRTNIFPGETQVIYLPKKHKSKGLR